MIAREKLNQLQTALGSSIRGADLPSDRCLFVFVEAPALKNVCQYVFRDLDARYVTSIGSDDRPYSGSFLVAHNFAFDQDHVLCSMLTEVSAIQSHGGQHLGRCARGQLGGAGIARPGGHRTDRPSLSQTPGPAGWLAGRRPPAAQGHSPGISCPTDYDDTREFKFDEPPEGCTVVPFGPFHPTLDEPAHFRLYVDGERVRGCEYRGFMVHRGIEKLAESVLSYNDIPIMAERICGICGCVHNVAYAQAVESAAALQAPPRAEYLRTIMLELERLHSHLLWVGLACHIVGFDTLFMQCFRIREPVMWVAEKITGNRKTYGLCVIGGVRRDLTARVEGRIAPGARPPRNRMADRHGRRAQGPQHPEAHARRRRRRPQAGEGGGADRPGGARGGRGD